MTISTVAQSAADKGNLWQSARKLIALLPIGFQLESVVRSNQPLMMLAIVKAKTKQNAKTVMAAESRIARHNALELPLSLAASSVTTNK